MNISTFVDYTLHKGGGQVWGGRIQESGFRNQNKGGKAEYRIQKSEIRRKA